MNPPPSKEAAADTGCRRRVDRVGGPRQLHAACCRLSGPAFSPYRVRHWRGAAFWAVFGVKLDDAPEQSPTSSEHSCALAHGLNAFKAIDFRVDLTAAILPRRTVRYWFALLVNRWHMAWRIAAVVACIGFTNLLAGNAMAEPNSLSEQQQVVKKLKAMKDAFLRDSTPIDVKVLNEVDIALAKTTEALFVDGDFKNSAYGLIRQANVRNLRHDPRGAIVLLSRAVAVARKAEDSDLQAEALSSRALSNIQIVQLGEGLTDATNAVRNAEASGNAATRANALNALGHAQLVQGDTFAAVETAEREIAAASAAPNRLLLFYAYMSQVDAYGHAALLCRTMATHDPCAKSLDAARAATRQARAVAKELGYAGLAFMEQGADAMIGAIQSEIDHLLPEMSPATAYHFKTAEDIANWSVELIVPKGKATKEQIATLDQALSRSRQFAKDAGMAPEYVYDPESLYEEGFLREQEGRHDEALDWFWKATQALERDRRTLSDDGSRSAFMAGRNNIYLATALQFLHHRRYAEAFDVIERSRSRVLTDLLASRPPQTQDNRGQALYSEVSALREQVGKDQARLFTIGGGGVDTNGSPAADYAAMAAKLRNDEDHYQKALARLAAEAPTLHSLVVAPSADFGKLQGAMREEGFETLQYLMTESGLVVWHTSAAGSYARSVLVTRAQLIAAIDALTTSLRDPRRPFNEAAARELFLFLVEPVLTHIGPSKRLVIIPNDDMANLPFETLVDPSDGTFLGEHFQVSYAPSGTVLLSLQRSTPLRAARALALADPGLPGGRAEIDSIRRALDGRGVFDASHPPRKADLKRWVADADLVHLAVHGDFSKADPMSSFLLLDRSAGDDGKLSAMEMFALPLTRKPLVVLSACETGISATGSSGETLGMLRALLFAGANGLLLSQWPVESEPTARWMQAFYEAAVSKPPGEAAQLASARVRANPATRHPYFWAPFLLVAR